MMIKRKSPFSGKINAMDIDITEEQLQEYQKGSKPIQNVFPHLTSDEREFIMTGITPDEWNETFGGN
jgi:hypothetical protein